MVINYERLFEIRDIANENMSGEKTKHTLRKVYKMIRENSKDKKIGKCFIRFGDPINLKDFIK